MTYRQTQNYENLQRRIFDGVGEYDIPQIKPIMYDGNCEFIGFNYAKSEKNRGAREYISFWMITNLMCYGIISTNILTYYHSLNM